MKDKTKGAAEQAYNAATDFPSDAGEMAGVLLVLCVRRVYTAAANNHYVAGSLVVAGYDLKPFLPPATQTSPDVRFRQLHRFPCQGQ